MTKKGVVLIWSFCLAFGGCTTVISERTDEDAWLEFKKESLVTRLPASVEPSLPAKRGIERLSKLLEAVPTRALLVQCGRFSRIETCFNDAMVRRVDEVYRSDRAKHEDLTDADYRRAKAEFLKNNAYSVISAEVERFHQGILSGVDLASRARMRALFAECENAKNPESGAEPEVKLDQLELIKGITTEIPNPVFVCLGARWESELENALNETSRQLGLKFTTREAREWVEKNQVAPIFESELAHLLNSRALKELHDFQIRKHDLLNGFNLNESNEKLLIAWTPVLRKWYPYSSVEQWILQYKKGSK